MVHLSVYSFVLYSFTEWQLCARHTLGDVKSAADLPAAVRVREGRGKPEQGPAHRRCPLPLLQCAPLCGQAGGGPLGLCFMSLACPPEDVLRALGWRGGCGQPRPRQGPGGGLLLWASQYKNGFPGTVGGMPQPVWEARCGHRRATEKPSPPRPRRSRGKSCQFRCRFLPLPLPPLINSEMENQRRSMAPLPFSTIS